MNILANFFYFFLELKRKLCLGLETKHRNCVNLFALFILGQEGKVDVLSFLEHIDRIYRILVRYFDMFFQFREILIIEQYCSPCEYQKM